jgi:hypothetical protein
MTKPPGPMPKLIREEAYWNHRAEEARAVAEVVRNPDSKRIMEDIADTYAHLAKLTKTFHAIAMRPLPRPEGDARKR